MVMEFGEVFTMIPTSVNGDIRKPKAMEFTLGEMVIAMKANGSAA
jgi:hypothetical protein